VGIKETQTVQLVGGKADLVNKKLKLFWGALCGMAIWEIVPQYMCVLP
jgi:hypothetical protein